MASTAATGRSTSRRTTFAAFCARCATMARRRQCHDPAQGGCLRAGRPPRRGGRSDRRGQHAVVRGRRALGGNTDAYGFAANLDEYAPGWAGNGPAVVLGAGGAARAVIHALVERGVSDIRIVNRTLRARRSWPTASAPASPRTAWKRPAELLADAGLLVNTTSLGMHGNEALAADPAGSARPCHRHRHRLRAAGDAACSPRRAQG